MAILRRLKIVGVAFAAAAAFGIFATATLAAYGMDELRRAIWPSTPAQVNWAYNSVFAVEVVLGVLGFYAALSFMLHIGLIVRHLLAIALGKPTEQG